MEPEEFIEASEPIIVEVDFAVGKTLTELKKINQ